MKLELFAHNMLPDSYIEYPMYPIITVVCILVVATATMCWGCPLIGMLFAYREIFFLIPESQQLAAMWPGLPQM